MTKAAPISPGRVVHLTTVHSPFDVRIFHKQCVSLAEAGYDVTLVQRGDRDEIVAGVRILPLPTYRARFARMTLGVWKAIRLARAQRPDIVHIHDVELIWGALILKLAGSMVIYDVHEDVAKDLEDKAYLPRWAIPPVRWAVKAVELSALAFFDHISAATSSIYRRFPKHSATLIRNTPIVGELSKEESPPFSSRQNKVVYLGGLADLNNPQSMVAAMGRLPEDLEPVLVLGGKFPDSAVECEVRDCAGWQRVDYRGWVDRSAIKDIFAEARCGLVLYRPSPNVVDAEPNKFFELLSAGLPIVVSDFPVWKALVERLGCGIAVNPLDPVAIADAVEYLLRNPAEAEAMGRRGQDAVLNDYNWSSDARALLAAYSRLLRGSPS